MAELCRHCDQPRAAHLPGKMNPGVMYCNAKDVLHFEPRPVEQETDEAEQGLPPLQGVDGIEPVKFLDIRDVTVGGVECYAARLDDLLCLIGKLSEAQRNAVWDILRRIDYDGLNDKVRRLEQERDAAIAERETAAQNYKRLLEDRDKRVEQVAALIGERDAAIARAEELREKCDDLVTQLSDASDGQLSAYDVRIHAEDRAVKLRARVSELEAKLVEAEKRALDLFQMNGNAHERGLAAGKQEVEAKLAEAEKELRVVLGKAYAVQGEYKVALENIRQLRAQAADVARRQRRACCEEVGSYVDSQDDDMTLGEVNWTEVVRRTPLVTEAQQGEKPERVDMLGHLGALQTRNESVNRARGICIASEIASWPTEPESQLMSQTRADDPNGQDCPACGKWVYEHDQHERCECGRQFTPKDWGAKRTSDPLTDCTSEAGFFTAVAPGGKGTGQVLDEWTDEKCNSVNLLVGFHGEMAQAIKRRNTLIRELETENHDLVTQVSDAADGQLSSYDVRIYAEDRAVNLRAAIAALEQERNHYRLDGVQVRRELANARREISALRAKEAPLLRLADAARGLVSRFPDDGTGMINGVVNLTGIYAAISKLYQPPQPEPSRYKEFAREWAEKRNAEGSVCFPYEAPRCPFGPTCAVKECPEHGINRLSRCTTRRRGRECDDAKCPEHGGGKEAK